MNETKVSQQINDVVGDNVKKLAQLFPSAVKDGEVDFEALKEELGSFTEVGDEKYELTWAGKADAKRIAREDIIGKTLKYIPEDSKDADTTENLYIEGDNLEVLKLLRQNYYGAIKVIYIDPPYNTGNDFVYNDSFEMGKEEADIVDGVRSNTGERYSVNKESSNRFHANWMNMIYTRLKIAKDLLTDDGAIFVSIDENEHENLLCIMNEIFGEHNYVDSVIWDKKSSAKGVPPRNMMVNVHEYIVVYQKSDAFSFIGEARDADADGFKNPDNDPRGPWRESNIKSTTRPIEEAFTIVDPNTGREYTNTWAFSRESLERMIKEDRIIWKETLPKQKEFMYEMTNENKAIKSNWGVFDAQSTTVYLKHLIPEVKFDNPKPINLMKYLVSVAVGKNDLILDFFSGSATTAHAIMQVNAEDDGNRRFILVQIPEPISEDTEAYKAGYSSICEIGKERMRRVGDEISRTASNVDTGFKVFRVADTNIKWNSLMDMGQLNVSQIESTPDLMDFMPNTKDIDVVYELMLRQRDVALSESVELLSDIGSRTYLYASSFLVCLETEVTESLVEKIAAIDPLPIKFIFRDSAFKDDIALKDETFRRLKALVEKNSGESKPTYTVEFI